MEKRDIEGKVIVQFIVEKDGALTNIQALRGPGLGSSEEAVRVMKLSPKWQPGYKDGQAVRTQIKMPVSFVLKKADPRLQPSGIKLINGG
jgi:TonB family protein